MMKDEQVANSQKGMRDLQRRIVELDTAFQSEYEKSTDNTGEMNRQYREMQERHFHQGVTCILAQYQWPHPIHREPLPKILWPSVNAPSDQHAPRTGQPQI